jgi:hypothetical protein
VVTTCRQFRLQLAGRRLPLAFDPWWKPCSGLPPAYYGGVAIDRKAGG